MRLFKRLLFVLSFPTFILIICLAPILFLKILIVGLGTLACYLMWRISEFVFKDK